MNTPSGHKTAALAARASLGAAGRVQQPIEAVAVSLTAAILAVRAGEPAVAVVPDQRAHAESLPSGPFYPREHRTLEGAVASCAHDQTGVEVGFLHQLCALADCPEVDGVQPTVSVSYLALVGPRQCSDRTPAKWRSWYAFFPWEDWRYGRPECLTGILSRLEAWAGEEEEPPCVAALPSDRLQRVRAAFGAAGA